jgi:hypothetical protein
MKQETKGGTILMKSLANKVINVLSAELDDEKMRTDIKDKVIAPFLKIVFMELNKYVYALVALIFLTLLFSLLTFLMSIMAVMAVRTKTI